MAGARMVRLPLGAHARAGKVVVYPTLSYLGDQPVARAELTPIEALKLAKSLVDMAVRVLEAGE